MFSQDSRFSTRLEQRHTEIAIGLVARDYFTSRFRILHLYGDVTIAGERLQNIGQCSVLTALSREGSLSCYTCCDTGPRFSVFIRKTASSFNRLLLLARGCGWPVLTRIRTGSHSVASCDTQGVLRTCFYSDLYGLHDERRMRIMYSEVLALMDVLCNAGVVLSV